MLKLNLKFLNATVILALALAMASPALGESKFSFASTPGQLPKDVIPQYYAITLKPDVQALTFKGSETIDIEVGKIGDVVVLNVLDLRISQARLVGEGGQDAFIQVDDGKQTATLTFPSKVQVGLISDTLGDQFSTWYTHLSCHFICLDGLV
jgi:Peptidase M1 N-terminal domain